jgi:hypothetical protein
MSKLQLAIELSDIAVRIAELRDGQVESIVAVSFKDRVDYRYKEQLDLILQEKGYREKKYDDYSLSWYSVYSTLIPNNVFNETKPNELMELCFHQTFPKNEIDYNRLPELGLINVFQLPHWVKSYFVIKFPRIVLQHQGSHMLRGIFAGSTFHAGAFITIHRDNFHLILHKENQLDFYAYFDYQNEEDIIYHLNFALQQKKWDSKNSKITLIQGMGVEEDLLNSLQNKLKQISTLKSYQIDIQKHLLLNFHELCV